MRSRLWLVAYARRALRRSHGPVSAPARGKDAGPLGPALCRSSRRVNGVAVMPWTTIDAIAAKSTVQAMVLSSLGRQYAGGKGHDT